MKTILAFLKLIRWQNLLFIVLTQILYEYCIYLPIYGSHSTHQLGFIILASVLIAAAGYIINDYFDLNIDQINKPNRVIVNNAVSRRWAIFWHLVLSLLGLFFTVLALPPSLYWYLILANLFSILLLWLYSTNFKKQLLIGNVIISILTSWVILILFFSKSPLSVDNIITADHKEIRLFRLTMLYAGFAFIISLVREVLKDMEDRIGDARYGCKTMPIVWGLPASKVFVAVWIIVLTGTLVILQLYVLAYGWWLSIVYCLLAIIAPLLIVLSKLTAANTQQDFHLLSRYVKAIMFTGILSMLFFYYYH
ncbi:MAG: geranylgeranylglycerol-phosphate geranylgeranyltransferase [Bacteroidetes bacterium]|nr:geranylgeranylglycerol-phosphate geranylgeranyltransferase [Bacteroidota bacterium]